MRLLLIASSQHLRLRLSLLLQALACLYYSFFVIEIQFSLDANNHSTLAEIGEAFLLLNIKTQHSCIDSWESLFKIDSHSVARNPILLFFHTLVLTVLFADVLWVSLVEDFKQEEFCI